jgi:predicted nuclease with RNAse H fold
MKVIGIDLAGSPNHVTGICLLNGTPFCKTFAVHNDEDILGTVLKARPDVISIDAPLSLPRGRKSIDQKDTHHFRKCDLELRKMKIRFFPVTLGPMRMLTARGMKLKEQFEKYRLNVIESYPGGAQDILRMPRKQKGIERLRKALIKFGIKGDVEKKYITHDELDAITCAIVGRMYLQKKYLALGDKKEGLMIMPKPKVK